MTAGRPRAIPSPEEFDRRVALYLEQLMTSNEKDGTKLYPTLTGLIIALGLSSRNSLDEYLNYEGFGDCVRRAKLLIEATYEQRLHSSGCTGAIFALKNFGWKDEQGVHHSGNIGLKEVLDDIDGNSAGLPSQDKGKA